MALVRPSLCDCFHHFVPIGISQGPYYAARDDGNVLSLFDFSLVDSESGIISDLYLIVDKRCGGSKDWPAKREHVDTGLKRG